VDLTQFRGRFSSESWRTISASFIAGSVFSFPVSWAACATAQGVFAEPVANAFIGISVSFVVYCVAFAALKRRPLSSVIRGLACRVTLEMAFRGLLHVGFMCAGMHAGWASFLAQLISGFGGHMSVPYFIRSESTVLSTKKV